MKIATTRRASTWLATAAAFSLATSLAAPDASAQEAAAGADSVSGDGKGIVGGALLGGEVVTITMGIIGVEEVWPYLVFGGLGAVGGGVGGWAVEQADPPAEAPLFMLAGGLTLIVPALVISLNAVSKDEPLDEQPASDGERAEPPQGSPSAPAAPPASGGASVNLGAQREVVDTGRRVSRTTSRAPRAPRARGAVDLGAERLELGVPAVQVQPLYTQQEITKYGVTQGTEVRVPVISAAF
jgi:hypothetical protein